MVKTYSHRRSSWKQADLSVLQWPIKLGQAQYGVQLSQERSGDEKNTAQSNVLWINGQKSIVLLLRLVWKRSSRKFGIQCVGSQLLWKWEEEELIAEWEGGRTSHWEVLLILWGFFWAVELLWVSEETSELAKSPAELERAQKCSEQEIRKNI